MWNPFQRSWMLVYMKEGPHCLLASASYFALQGHCCANRKY